MQLSYLLGQLCESSNFSNLLDVELNFNSMGIIIDLHFHCN